MRAKQKVIQEAWGETFYPGLDNDMGSWDEPDDDNHFYQHWKETGKVYRNFLNVHNKRILDRRQDIINLNGWFWPRSLDGIETNNGWIEIAKEINLPLDKVWLTDGNRMWEGKLFLYGSCGVRINTIATHFQPIIKPQPLIYQTTI